MFIGVDIDYFTVHHAVILAILNPTHEHISSNEEFGSRVKKLKLPLNPSSGLKRCVSSVGGFELNLWNCLFPIQELEVVDSGWQ